VRKSSFLSQNESFRLFVSVAVASWNIKATGQADKEDETDRLADWQLCH